MDQAGFIDRDRVLPPGQDYAGLREFGVHAAFVSTDPELLTPVVFAELMPREFLEEQKVLPLFLVRGVLTVAVSEVAPATGSKVMSCGTFPPGSAMATFNWYWVAPSTSAVSR